MIGSFASPTCGATAFHLWERIVCVRSCSLHAATRNQFTWAAMLVTFACSIFRQKRIQILVAPQAVSRRNKRQHLVPRSKQHSEPARTSTGRGRLDGQSPVTSVPDTSLISWIRGGIVVRCEVFTAPTVTRGRAGTSRACALCRVGIIAFFSLYVYKFAVGGSGAPTLASVVQLSVRTPLHIRFVRTRGPSLSNTPPPLT